MGNRYFGSKATTALCQALIALMPPHSVYIETHLGGCAIMRRKPAALRSIGIDRNGCALSRFEARPCANATAPSSPRPNANFPNPPQRIGGKRGRIAKSEAANLHEALATYETEVLRFAQDPDTPFTNNRAEPDIRMAKVKRQGH